MSYLPQAKTPDEVKKIGVADIRKNYNKIAEIYNKMLDGKILYCHKCNDFKINSAFYLDKRYKSGYYPVCKECILDMATDYDKETKTRKDNRDKTLKVFEMMDLPFFDSIYKSSLQHVADATGERVRETAFQSMIVQIKSLPAYRNKNWMDSDFESNNDVLEFGNNKKARREIKKLFGSGFTENDYVYLQDQYDDFKARTQVDTKSQEVYVMQICLSLLDIDRDRKNGKDVSKKIDSLDKLMNAANLQPKQNVNNSATDTLSLGQLIEKWEIEKPISEPSEEFKDVDGIGKYIRVWFAGWLSKAVGLNNGYTEECEEYISKYEVRKPEALEEGSSEEVYDKLFGRNE